MEITARIIPAKFSIDIFSLKINQATKADKATLDKFNTGNSCALESALDSKDLKIKNILK